MRVCLKQFLQLLDYVFIKKAGVFFCVLALLSIPLNSAKFYSSVPDATPIKAEEITELSSHPLPNQADIASLEELSANLSTPAKTVTQSAAPKNPKTPCASDYAAIEISGRTICIFATSNLTAETGSKVALYTPTGTLAGGSAFLFGHNSANVFAGLGQVSSFKIHFGGATKTYQIIRKSVYCDYSNANDWLAKKGSNIRHENDKYNCANFPTDPILNMNQVLNPKSVLGVEGISLMTCAGASIGNGDATHRLIAYAVEV
jgi:hypothetical protein